MVDLKLSSDNERIKTQYTFALAIIIVSAYVVFFGVVMYQNQTNNYEGLKTITATFGIIVAAVVGYYFGQRPAESAQQRAKTAEEKATENTTKLKNSVTENLDAIASGEEFYTRLANDLEKIKRDYGIE